MIGGCRSFNHDRRAQWLMISTILQGVHNCAMCRRCGRSNPATSGKWLERIGNRHRALTPILPFRGPGSSKVPATVHQPADWNPATGSSVRVFRDPPEVRFQLPRDARQRRQAGQPHITPWSALRRCLAEAASGERGSRLLYPPSTRQVMGWMGNSGRGEQRRRAPSRGGLSDRPARRAQPEGTQCVYTPGARICSFVASLRSMTSRYWFWWCRRAQGRNNAYGSTVAIAGRPGES